MYQVMCGIILSALMVVSSVLLTLRWFQVVHGNTDLLTTFYASLLTASLGLLMILNLHVMRRTVEEVESAKRVTSIGYREIEDRLMERLSRGLKDIEDRLSELERRMYR